MAAVGSLESFQLKMRMEKSNVHLVLILKSKAVDTLSLPPLERLDFLDDCTGISGRRTGP
jgi:hypothetical protein